MSKTEDKPGKGQTRREFVTTSAAALAAPHVIPASALGLRGHPSPGDKIRLGLIGAGHMGRTNLANCAKYDDVVVTAVCDVWKDRRDRTVAKYKDTAKPYHDYRELLAREDVDAVIIATPPHWHALQAVDACVAGKDLYLQKPMTLYPDESLAVRNAVRRHGRVCQIGTQMHSRPNFQRVFEYVRSGKLGKISVVRTFNVENQGPDGMGRVPDSAPPSGLDWNFWVGPARMRAFNTKIVPSAYYHCSFMDFSGGWTPGMAPHIFDLPFWALGLGFPTRTTCAGGRFTLRDNGDVPDTQEAVLQFPELTLTWSMALANSFGFDFGRGRISRRLGIYFHAVNGTLFTNYPKHEVVSEGDRLTDPKPPAKTLAPSPGHEREWLDCIKSRKQPSCNPDYHVKIDIAIGLVNLSYRLGRTVEFDPKTERIVGDDEATRLARPTYRDPWEFPKAYL